MTRTTQGTPSTTENPTPRLVLPIRTTTTPAIAITATFRMVTLTGGAASLCTRRRASRSTMNTANSTTAAIMTIQPASGLMAPPSMSFSTLLLSRIVPPESGRGQVDERQEQAEAAEIAGQRDHERRQPQPGDQDALNA